MNLIKLRVDPKEMRRRRKCRNLTKVLPSSQTHGLETLYTRNFAAILFPTFRDNGRDFEL